jgi:exopolysaccharide biosynthesis polyprenyl glycosylphosphotransferase
MLRRDRQMRMQFHQLVDALLFAASFGLAYILRANEHIIKLLKLAAPSPFESFQWLFITVIIAAPLVLEAQGFYNRPILCSRRAIWWPLFKGCLLTTVGLVLAVYFFRLTLARPVMIWFGFISFGIVYLKEELTLLIYKSKLAQAQYRRRFILAGTGDEIALMRKALKEQTDEGIDVVGEWNLGDASLQHLVQMLHESSAYGVIFSAKHAYFEQAEAVIKACELEGVEAWLIADFFGTQISRTTFDEFLGRPLLVFRSTPETSWQSVVKQIMDFIGALLLLLVLALPLALVAVLIKLTSPGPVLFRQQRSGLNGTPFTIYKFRTMVTNAEQLKHELEAMNEMRGPVFKVSKDPRITPIGKLLRRFSIDEFPQLFNVLRGEMSLVGPRPLPVDEVKQFNDFSHRRRLSVKPGLTCLWQIKGRNEIAEFRDWVRLDLEYIDNWSLWLDLKILLRTVPAVLAGTGAK